MFIICHMLTIPGALLSTSHASSCTCDSCHHHPHFLKEKTEAQKKTYLLLHIGDLLVHSGCHNRTPQTGSLNNRTYFSQSWRLTSSKSRCQNIQYLMQSCLLDCSWPSLCSHMIEETRNLSEVSFIRKLIPFLRATPLLPRHLPKIPLPNIITL